MATGLYNWSRAPGSNANATYNMAEGMAPSAVNDGIRGLMSDVAQYRDDIAGAIVTSGSSTAYTVASYSAFDTLAHMNGAMIAFTPHAPNGATVTLNVDGLGAKPLRSAPSVELLAGTLIQGTPYVATYNNSDAVWYLQSFYGNPYNIPLGGGLPFIGSTAPNSSFVFPYGQAISRITYATLFSLVSTTYGGGDGSTTFNLPDFRGRVLAGKDDMGGSAASRLTSAYFGTSAAALGAVGGGESQTLTLAQLPTGITSANAAQVISVTSGGHNLSLDGTIVSDPGTGGSGNHIAGMTLGSVISTGNNSISVVSNNTSGSVHANVQPTIICNYIIRVI